MLFVLRDSTLLCAKVYHGAPGPRKSARQVRPDGGSMWR